MAEIEPPTVEKTAENKECFVEELEPEIELDEKTKKAEGANGNGTEGADDEAPPKPPAAENAIEEQTSSLVDDDDDDEPPPLEEQAEDSQKQIPNIMKSAWTNNRGESYNFLGEVKFDYGIIDSMLAFLDQEELFPILCGYFNKIFQSLLGKQKKNLFEYLLLEREGSIFDKLLLHIDHHSLAQLLIELMQTSSVYGNSVKKNDG